jgi:hypothetical protein
MFERGDGADFVDTSRRSRATHLRMARGQRIAWLVPTLLLCGLWLVSTWMIIGLSWLNVPLPGFVAKASPFIVAGFITGRVAGFTRHHSRIVAAGGLALVSAIGWTLVSGVLTALSAMDALLLFAMSLPVHMLGGAWAFLGMLLGGRRSIRESAGSRTEVDPEIDQLERELKSELAREHAPDVPSAP